MSDLPPVVDPLALARTLDRPYTPRVVARLNDLVFKVAWVRGDFPWHHHADTDEAFWILEGEVELDFEGGTRTLRAGELCVVPRGAPHRPRSDAGARIALIEPAGVVNTGENEPDERTAETDVWIE